MRCRPPPACNISSAVFKRRGTAENSRLQGERHSRRVPGLNSSEEALHRAFPARTDQRCWSRVKPEVAKHLRCCVHRREVIGLLLQLPDGEAQRAPAAAAAAAAAAVRGQLRGHLRGQVRKTAASGQALRVGHRGQRPADGRPRRSSDCVDLPAAAMVPGWRLNPDPGQPRPSLAGCWLHA
jgi:hypothetical protein